MKYTEVEVGMLHHSSPIDAYRCSRFRWYPFVFVFSSKPSTLRSRHGKESKNTVVCISCNPRILWLFLYRSWQLNSWFRLGHEIQWSAKSANWGLLVSDTQRHSAGQGENLQALVSNCARLFNECFWQRPQLNQPCFIAELLADGYSEDRGRAHVTDDVTEESWCQPCPFWLQYAFRSKPFGRSFFTALEKYLSGMNTQISQSCKLDSGHGHFHNQNRLPYCIIFARTEMRPFEMRRWILQKHEISFHIDAMPGG